MDRAFPSLAYLPHTALTVLVILAGIQDWRNREVTDWLTWPMLIGGIISVIKYAVYLDFLPLAVSIFLLIVWYCEWLGGADVRVLIGLWGLWPLAGFLALLATGLWGLVLVLRKRGNEKFPALVSIAFAVVSLFFVEQFH